MDRKDTNPSANVPNQAENEPRGDRGQGDKTWSPEPGAQGISNRPDDASDRYPVNEPENIGDSAFESSDEGADEAEEPEDKSNGA